MFPDELMDGEWCNGLQAGQYFPAATHKTQFENIEVKQGVLTLMNNAQPKEDGHTGMPELEDTGSGAVLNAAGWLSFLFTAV